MGDHNHLLERVKVGKQVEVSEVAELGPEWQAGPIPHYGKTAGDSDPRNDHRSIWKKREGS